MRTESLNKPDARDVKSDASKKAEGYAMVGKNGWWLVILVAVLFVFPAEGAEERRRRS